MLKKSLIFSAIFSGHAYAKEIKAKKASSHDGYLFLESAVQERLLLIVGKTETVISSMAENTTTTGLPIRSWVIKTRWIDDRKAHRSALNKAIAEHPEWESFAKDREDIQSAYCRFKLSDPDIKVAQGDRSTSLSSASELCTYVVHTKNGGDEKLRSAIESNSAIDSGLGIVKVKLQSEPKFLFDARNISDSLQNLIADQNRLLSEKEAAFFLGASFANYTKDGADGQENLFDQADQTDLLKGLQLVFPKLFEIQLSNPNSYKYRAIKNPTEISVDRAQNLSFDPQGKE